MADSMEGVVSEGAPPTPADVEQKAIAGTSGITSCRHVSRLHCLFRPLEARFLAVSCSSLFGLFFCQPRILVLVWHALHLTLPLQPLRRLIIGGPHVP